MKRLIAGVGIALLSLVFTGVASAATIDGVNDESSVSVIAQWLLRVMIHNDNDAAIYNNATATANSGNNTVVSDDDQTGTEITTGDASAAVVVDNKANGNFASVEVESANGTDTSISQVNDESSVVVETSDEVGDYECNSNTVTVENQVDATANTGDNTVTSGDELEGTVVSSGVTESATGIGNLFNINIKRIIRTIAGSI